MKYYQTNILLDSHFELYNNIDTQAAREVQSPSYHHKPPQFELDSEAPLTHSLLKSGRMK